MSGPMIDPNDGSPSAADVELQKHIGLLYRLLERTAALLPRAAPGVPELVMDIEDAASAFRNSPSDDP